MTKHIEFSSEGYTNFRERYMSELAAGRLPGVFGLAQDLANHWIIRKDVRGPIAYGRAILNTVGTLYSYKESKKDSKKSGKDPILAWLKKQNCNLAFKGADYSLTSFIKEALSDIEFEKINIREGTGFAKNIILGFDIGESTAYFIADAEATKTWWKGPYCKIGEVDLLEQFIGKHIWERLETTTLKLARLSTYLGDNIRVEALSDDFDFLSCDDNWNDAKKLADRSAAFLEKNRSRCLLFQGPPGTGKSTLARAIAREMKRNILIADRDAMHSLSGGTISHIISMLDPGVLVLDDVDRLNDDEHLSLLDSLEFQRKKTFLTILTVNDITRLDPAMLRPGRISNILEVKEPTTASRLKLLDYYEKKYRIHFSSAQREKIMIDTDGFSPSDIQELCETAEAVGVDLAMDELPRLKLQRKLYADDACKEFNKGKQ